MLAAKRLQPIATKADDIVAAAREAAQWLRRTRRVSEAMATATESVDGGEIAQC